MAAQIKFVQGANAPPSGEALLGVTGVVVAATNGSGETASSYTWTMVDVPPSSLVLKGFMGNTSGVAFTPDVSGSYLLRLDLVVGGVSSSDTRAVMVPSSSLYNRVIPPYDAPGSALNVGGQARGWANWLEPYFNLIDRIGDISTVAPLHNQVLIWNSALGKYVPGPGYGGAETFVATCSPTVAVGSAVHVSGFSGGLPTVVPCDYSDPTTLPASGIVYAKASSTECSVQTNKKINIAGMGFTAGSKVFVGTSGSLITSLSAIPGYFYAHCVGYMISDEELVILPSMEVIQAHNSYL